MVLFVIALTLKRSPKRRQENRQRWVMLTIRVVSTGPPSGPRSNEPLKVSFADGSSFGT